MTKQNPQKPITVEYIIEDLTLFVKADRAELGLWVIAHDIKEKMGIQSETEIKKLTFEIVKKLMEKNIMPGHLARGSFNFWTSSPTESLVRIEAEWPKNGIPTLASGTCWFYSEKEYLYQ